MSIENIVGLTLGEARSVLNEIGFYIGKVIVTAPPREKSGEFDDSFRVIRLSGIHDSNVDVLVCKPL